MSKNLLNPDLILEQIQQLLSKAKEKNFSVIAIELGRQELKILTNAAYLWRRVDIHGKEDIIFLGFLVRSSKLETKLEVLVKCPISLIP